jgi:5-methylcytosine-specific restriction endonuclease McrA
VIEKTLYDPVLLLNANYEPLNVCTTRRAMNLIITDKATLVLDGRGVIRTVTKSFPRPSVIRLYRMIHRPRQSVRLTKREILRRDNYTCQYCGKRTPYLTIDHVLPRRLGGSHTWTNLVAACPTCNHRKGGRTIEQAQMHLLRAPNRPPSSARYLFAGHVNDNQDWVDFIEGW